MSWHIDPIASEPIECSGIACMLYPQDKHFKTRKEATEAISLLDSILNPVSHTPHDLVFRPSISSITQKRFLEVEFITQLDEKALITIEEKENHALGSLLIRQREYGLALTWEKGLHTLEDCARESLRSALKEFKDELWPEESVVKLYKDLSKYSTTDEIHAPGGIMLHEKSSKEGQQRFAGRTATGTRISILVSDGYGIAEAEYKHHNQLLYQAGLANETFTTMEERNAFAAKAFGELIFARV